MGHFGFVLCLLSCSFVSAQTIREPSLQARQRDQERARAMAAELVSGVLDVQLRQLEENQLQKLPIYSEIKQMRQNIGELVEDEMPDVVDLLLRAEKAKESERDEIQQEARARIRTVVVTLMAERQRLYKRMRLARLAAQLRQLIDSESKVLRTTRSLPEESPQSRERLVLLTLDDQRDVTAIHFQFVDVLSDVATWEGELGAGALKGLRLLKTLQIEKELQRAESNLAAGQFAAAQSGEQAAIRGWEALLEVVEQAQGLAGSDRGTLAKLVAETIKQQESVREQTKSVDAQDLQRTEQLAQEQHEIQQKLADLSEAVKSVPNTEALAEQAKAASLDAEAKLFEGSTTAAVQQQGQVIGALAEIAQRIKQSAGETEDKTAEQLAQEVQKLEQLDRALDKARATQAEVEKHAATNAPAAKRAEDQVAQQLQQANQAADFGPALETRLADAHDDVARAQTSLANASPDMAVDRKDASREATASIDRAAAEVKQELADARRQQLAVQLGELARAAEALERAAAAEREIAAVTAEAGKKTGLTAEAGEQLKEEQGRVADVARNIAEGLKTISPSTSQKLAAASGDLQSVRQQLESAIKTPDDASKQASSQAAQNATKAAGQLEEAAKELRQQSGTTATTLAKVAADQLKPVQSVRAEVEKALDSMAAQQTDAPNRSSLQQALQAAKQAQIEQLRAAGKKSEAAARDVAQQVDQAFQRQQAAEAAVRDFMHGRSNSPLRAAGLEEDVGDLARDVAKNADSTVARELNAAADAAEEAAKELLVGNPNTATAARRKAREALQRAQQAAKKVADEAAKHPAEEPDLTAQKNVSRLAQEAAEKAGDEAPDAKNPLQKAAEQSDAAAKALESKLPPVAQNAQEQTAAALEQSVAALQRAAQDAAKAAQTQSEALAKQAADLANKAVSVDAGAAAALEQATSAAARPQENMAEPKEVDSAEAADALPAVTRGLEQATASLAAREQELQRDKDIAEAIAQLAAEQQRARDQIAAEAAKLAELAEKEPPADAKALPPPSEEQMRSAQALSQAADAFAEAQRATGEGAAEISGQEQVANPPIRQGLETASDLGRSRQQPGGPEANGAELAQNNSGQEATPPEMSGGEPTSELGTGFVPQSPEETARRIAGREALEEATKLLANQRGGEPLAGDLAKNSSPSAAPNSQQPADSEPAAAEQTQSARAGEAALAAKAGKNDELDPDRIQEAEMAKERDSRAASEKNDGQVADRRFQDEPWFAKLPPSLQKAIQARSRRNPPRGYEERLKRYFESVD